MNFQPTFISIDYLITSVIRKDLILKFPFLLWSYMENIFSLISGRRNHLLSGEKIIRKGYILNVITICSLIFGIKITTEWTDIHVTEINVHNLYICVSLCFFPSNLLSHCVKLLSQRAEVEYAFVPAVLPSEVCFSFWCYYVNSNSARPVSSATFSVKPCNIHRPPCFFHCLAWFMIFSYTLTVH